MWKRGELLSSGLFVVFGHSDQYDDMKRVESCVLHLKNETCRALTKGFGQKEP